MKAIRKIYTVEEICKGFTYNEAEGKGLFGLSGKLTIQPEYHETICTQSRTVHGK